jgi:hypothetical protein
VEAKRTALSGSRDKTRSTEMGSGTNRLVAQLVSNIDRDGDDKGREGQNSSDNDIVMMSFPSPNEPEKRASIKLSGDSDMLVCLFFTRLRHRGTLVNPVLGISK